MIRQILKCIKKSNTVAVLCHVNADGDALCSSYALADVLASMGKKVMCILEEEPGKKYDFLGGEYEVYNSNTPHSFDLCIAVDCGSIDRLGNRRTVFENSKYTLNIDHHKSNNDYAKFNVVKPSYCAAAEVLVELFEKMKLRLSDNAARLLYGGIMSDSACLKFSSTTPQTHEKVARLLKYDFDHSEVTRMLFDNNPMELIKLTGHVMSNVETYENGLVSLIVTDSALLKKYGVDDSDANNLINIPRQVSGTEIAVEVKERGDAVRVSLRSNGKAEVDRVAALFGGGGHVRASGVSFKDKNLDEVKQIILKAVAEELRRVGF